MYNEVTLFFLLSLLDENFASFCVPYFYPFHLARSLYNNKKIRAMSKKKFQPENVRGESTMRERWAVGTGFLPNPYFSCP